MFESPISASSDLESTNSEEQSDVASDSYDFEFEYDASIKKLLNNYENSAQYEHNYLLGTTYKLKSDYFIIKMGLSPIRTFGVSVALSQHQDQFQLNTQMTFGYHEWCLVIDLLQQKYETFFDQPLSVSQSEDECDPAETKCGDYILFTQMIYDYTKMLHIAKLGVDGKLLVGYYLQEDNVREILEVNALLLSHRRLMLEKLNFNMYYTNLIDTVKLMIWNKELDGLDVLNVICDGSNNTPLSLALREYIYLNKQNVINDLNKI